MFMSLNDYLMGQLQIKPSSGTMQSRVKKKATTHSQQVKVERVYGFNYRQLA